LGIVHFWHFLRNINDPSFRVTLSMSILIKNVLGCIFSYAHLVVMTKGHPGHPSVGPFLWNCFSVTLILLVGLSVERVDYELIRQARRVLRFSRKNELAAIKSLFL
jgi:heme exporter protein D